jgi:hypothetical protein
MAEAFRNTLFIGRITKKSNRPSLKSKKEMSYPEDIFTIFSKILFITGYLFGMMKFIKAITSQ